MTKFLDGTLNTIKRKHLAVVLRALLDRLPVIIFSDSPDSGDLLSEELVKLIPHRREVVFGSDFISNTEHEQMIIHEQSDYNGERIVFRAPTSAIQLVAREITNFKGWIITAKDTDYESVLNEIKGSQAFITLRLQNGNLTLKHNGHFKQLLKISFEQKLLEKVTSETRTKMERITRILRRAAHGKVSERLEKSLVDLHHEEERVRHSLFREQIQAFVEAAWRVMIILMRLRLLEGVGVTSIISDKMLRQAIDYKGASIERLMEFIRAEWGEDLRTAVQGGRGRNFGDRLEGFWSI